MIFDLIFEICKISSHGKNLKHNVSFPIFDFSWLLSGNVSRSFLGDNKLNRIFKPKWRRFRHKVLCRNFLTRIFVLGFQTKYHPNLTAARFAIGGVSWCWIWWKIFGIGIFEISCGVPTALPEVVWLIGMGDFDVDCCEEDCCELNKLWEFCWESEKLSWECCECFFDDLVEFSNWVRSVIG